MKHRSHDEVIAQYFRENPAYATELLNEVRRNGDLAELAIVLRQATIAFGQNGVWSLDGTELKLSTIH
ncbi:MULTISPECIES: transcriptional regulator [Pseudomonas]|uniref:transcriptional regulator n=1 Tax=Pseudomonas TaxID=286 RepID=UPI000F0322BD|nr:MULTISPECIES: transcriptional regulator [Pseudomonas]MBJ2304309.1 transcriptional regulator [Pseudomonas sp. MF2846]MBK3444647.1 transcriptional regulator [Pseudomonas lactis]MBK3489040.1 transcriptional regulator [Pseudomonas sp. MF2857]